MAKSPVEVWLWLLLVMQPYNKKTTYILEQCGGDAAQAGRNIRDGKYDFLSETEIKNAKQVRMGNVKRLMEICEKNNIRILTLDDEDYPRLLRGIGKPPIVLFCAGDVSILSNRITLSAVGTRRASDYSLKATNAILTPLAKLDIVIVSGMAVGIDACAHETAIAAGGKTAGVLGCGILVNYPAENAELKREVIKTGGCLISELLPNTKCFGAYFHERNRIISGLSMGTFVAQAGIGSGALLTAEHAFEQNREVFCIPPQDIFSERYNGVVPILREGAHEVYNFTDILDEFSMYFSSERYFKDAREKLEKIENKMKAPQKPHLNSKKSAKTRETSKEDMHASEKNAVGRRFSLAGAE